MSWFSDITKAVSRPIKKAIHNPVAKGALAVGTVATGGLLAPVALGVSSAGLAHNVATHGAAKGLKKSASEELSAKDPREAARVANKLLPSKLRKNVDAVKLVETAMRAVPGGSNALDNLDAAKRALSGRPEDIVKAAAAGINLSGGGKLEHEAAIQSAINKLPFGVKSKVAAAANAVTKTHEAVQNRIKSQAMAMQRTGVLGYFIRMSDGKKIRGNWRFSPTGAKGFLLTADGHVRVGSFGRVS
jgi:hypothetical protein